LVIDQTLESIVGVRASIPEDAFTADILGTERAGSGVVIRESGLVLTIGYLITEAENVWLTSAKGQAVPAHALGYDQETGFGLVQALGALDLPALELGSTKKAKIGDPVILAGGSSQFIRGKVIGKQEFAGYWEYLLDQAIFTAPAHMSWGGAGLIGVDGKLIGVGSLLLQQVTDKGEPRDINMSVPIDLLPPVLDDLLKYGRVNKPARPWLGIYSASVDDRVLVANVAERGPAAAAGLKRGDVISGIRDQAVEGLADFYRKAWASGPAGVEIPIEVVRDGRSMWLRIKTADRASFLRKPKLQ
jgi:S1-C subfamily serine protease